MRKCLLLSALLLGGLLGGGGRASAFGSYHWYPYPIYQGYYGSMGGYYYPPYYPWFAYYSYASSPYAWPGGYTAGNYPAYVRGMTDGPPYSPKAGHAATATVTCQLPAEAELTFDGQPAKGPGGPIRSFQTAALEPGQAYEYTLTARLMRNGKTETATKRVLVKAGEETTVTLAPSIDLVGLAAK